MTNELATAKNNLSVAYSGAIYRLRTGHAASYDVSNLVRVLRVSEELCAVGIGDEHRQICATTRTALIAIDARHAITGRYTATKTEVDYILSLLELMDAQVAAATGLQLAAALDRSYGGEHES